MQFPERLTADHLFDAHIDLAPVENIGATPLGQRSIHIVTGGTFEGPRLRGKVRPGGGDWLLTLPNGANELDVRLTLQADDGALIYMSYRGVLDVAPEVAGRVMRGDSVDPGEFYFRTTPRLETGAEPYAWLNKLICVGAGYFGPNKVGYRVFAVR